MRYMNDTTAVVRTHRIKIFLHFKLNKSTNIVHDRLSDQSPSFQSPPIDSITLYIVLRYVQPEALCHSYHGYICCIIAFAHVIGSWVIHLSEELKGLKESLIEGTKDIEDKCLGKDFYYLAQQ